MRAALFLTPIFFLGLLAALFVVPASADLDPSWRDTELTTTLVSASVSYLDMSRYILISFPL